ncbi:UNVERIFIED_CONTAM: hypothetical protein FKN15_001829 [Acipenser sinensis]
MALLTLPGEQGMLIQTTRQCLVKAKLANPHAESVLSSAHQCCDDFINHFNKKVTDITNVSSNHNNDPLTVGHTQDPVKIAAMSRVKV